MSQENGSKNITLSHFSPPSLINNIESHSKKCKYKTVYNVAFNKINFYKKHSQSYIEKNEIQNSRKLGTVQCAMFSIDLYTLIYIFCIFTSLVFKFFFFLLFLYNDL